MRSNRPSGYGYKRHALVTTGIEHKNRKAMATEIFNYFTQTELPSPTLPDSEVVELVQKYFGVATTASSLGSQQDQNFVLRLSDSGDVL